MIFKNTINANGAQAIFYESVGAKNYKSTHAYPDFTYPIGFLSLYIGSSNCLITL
jgi:hypothetical protein